MKNQAIAIILAFFAFTACKKSSTTSDPPKTLTKSLLYNKTWYNQGPTISNYFNSNGKYGASGTWNWLNNSDSMEIISGTREVWYFDLSAAHEYSARHGKNGASILFKDAKW